MRISDWSSDVCSSDLQEADGFFAVRGTEAADRDRPPGGRGFRARLLAPQGRGQGVSEGMLGRDLRRRPRRGDAAGGVWRQRPRHGRHRADRRDRKSTRLNSSTNAHLVCRLLLEKKKKLTQGEENNTR